MTVLVRRAAAALAAALLGAAGVLLVPGAAAAAPSDRTFTVTGDPGDYVTAGRSYSYAAANSDVIRSTLLGSSTLRIRVSAANGDDWGLELAAPAGQAIAPGTYTGAQRFPQGGPGLDFTGNGRGCNTATGSFTISTLVVTDGQVTDLDADFEQHCEGAPPAARGSVHITGPAPLTLGLGITDGSLEAGDVVLNGTLTCSKAVRVSVNGILTQPADGNPSGDYQVFVDCAPGGAQPWTVTVHPAGDEPFQAGEASTDATAEATDPADGSPVAAYGGAMLTLAGNRTAADVLQELTAE